MLVRPDHGTVENHPFEVGVLQGLEDPLPDPLFRPAIEPLPGRVPRTEPLGEITPRRARLGDPEHGIDEETVILGGHAGITRQAGKEVFDACSVLLHDLVATHL